MNKWNEKSFEEGKKCDQGRHHRITLKMVSIWNDGKIWVNKDEKNRQRMLTWHQTLSTHTHSTSDVMLDLKRFFFRFKSHALVYHLFLEYVDWCSTFIALRCNADVSSIFIDIHITLSSTAIESMLAFASRKLETNLTNSIQNGLFLSACVSCFVETLLNRTFYYTIWMFSVKSVQCFVCELSRSHSYFSKMHNSAKLLKWISRFHSHCHTHIQHIYVRVLDLQLFRTSRVGCGGVCVCFCDVKIDKWTRRIHAKWKMGTHFIETERAW